MSLRLVLFCLLFASCASGSRRFVSGDQAPEGVKKKLMTYASPSSCRGHRGSWKSMSDAQVFPDGGYCMLKASDAGKPCASSSECQSYCELTFDGDQDKQKPQCAAMIPPQWDRCLPGYFEKGKVLGRGECFGEDSEVQ